MTMLRWILLIIGLLVIAGVYLWTRRQARLNGDHLPLDLGRIDDTPLDAPREDRAPSPLTGDELEDELAGLGKIVAEPAPLPEQEIAVRLDAQDRATHGLAQTTAAEAPAVARPVPAPPAEPAAPQPVAAEPGRSEHEGSRAERPGPATPRPPEEGDKIVALFVVAPRGQPFRGSQVTQALQDAGLQFGAMDIYHRYPQGDSAAEPVFSVANLVDPGTFDPAAMDDFVTPGLSLFMRLPGPMTGSKALADLVATAERLAESLNGELRDQTRSVLSRQTIEALREEVVEFERRQSIRHG